MQETTAWNLNQSRKQNEAELEKMKQNPKMHIYELTKKEQEVWKQKFSPLYDEFEREFGSELLHQIKAE